MVPTHEPGMAIFMFLNQWVVNIAEFGLLKGSGGKQTSAMQQGNRKRFSQLY